MPKQTLVYRVTVDDADAESARLYLQKLRQTFQLITEDLAKWGYSGDETYSTSEIFHEPTRT